MGYEFEGFFYFDVTLPKGLANSAFLCQKVTNSIMYIYCNEGYQGVNYLDDLAAAEIQQLAQQAYDILGQILLSLGVKEAVHKAVEPTMVVVFLGILINTILMRIEIEPSRLVEIRQELQLWKGRMRANLRQLQSLVGKLSFCATTVRSGRLFFSRILNFMRTLYQDSPWKQVELPMDVFKDIDWWLKFMPMFNGISMIPDPRWVAPNAIIQTDACLQAAGGWSQGEYFHVMFPQFVKTQVNSINELECIAHNDCPKTMGI